jgi:hypothetical protein
MRDRSAGTAILLIVALLSGGACTAQKSATIASAPPVSLEAPSPSVSPTRSDAGVDSGDGDVCTEELQTKRGEVAVEKARGELFGDQMLDHTETVIAAYLDACTDCCSNAARATLWTYVAYVRRFERHDATSAEQAFEKALRLDARVQLDPEVERDQKLAKAFARRRLALGIGDVDGGE